MGSLPNLHELEHFELHRERKQERMRRKEQRTKDASRECERMATFFQSKQASYNAYLMAGLGMGGGTLGMATTAGAAHFSNVSAGVAATATAMSGLTGGSGAALLGIAASGLWPSNYEPRRHSLTTRNRIMHTTSTGCTHNLWDGEQIIERLASYSPISSRSHRINPVSSHQVQAALAASRRRESVNSSIGATSIRRLLTLNNRNCRHKVPAHVRRKVCKQFTCFTIAHGLNYAVLLPLFGLQASNSIWHHREQWLHIGPNIGSMFLSITYLLAAGMSLLSTRFIRAFGYTLPIIISYAGLSIVLLCHFYPSIYTLLPAYILLGITLSPAWVSKLALVVQFSSRLSCSQHDISFTALDALVDEHQIVCNRDQKMRRLARWFQFSQDLGIIVGAVVASLVLACTSSDWNCFGTANGKGLPIAVSETVSDYWVPAYSSPMTPIARNLNSRSTTRFWPFFTGYFDDFYNHNEHGVRICGADMCPMRRSLLYNEFIPNNSIYMSFIDGQGSEGGVTLVSIYFTFSLLALLLTFFSGKAKITFRQERSRGCLADTLLFAGPFAYFIGTEQAYMLGDFLRAFVSCSLGISMVAGVLIAMGLMQMIVAYTLSLLLKYTKRIVIILAGCFFHSCLLLAISRWKPSSDDSALFYVLAASWGACNGMWETLLTALITQNHANQATEVAGALQALRSLGMGVAFAAHGFLCETMKILMVVIILVVSVPPYATLEIRLEAQRKTHMNNL